MRIWAIWAVQTTFPKDEVWFSLLQLLVVTALLATLAILAVPHVLALRQKSCVATLTAIAESILQALRASDSLQTKWTFDLSIHRAASGRHISEANANRFALSPQVHCTKPFDNLCQQASIRQR
jgi:type II secretory pathway pseudopilin PulG